MEKALLKLLFSLGEVAEQALTCQNGSEMWFKCYSESSDRELALKHENEELRAKLAELSKPKEAANDENNK